MKPALSVSARVFEIRDQFVVLAFGYEQAMATVLEVNLDSISGFNAPRNDLS